MSRCESSGSCSFFTNEMGGMPSLVRVMKRQYCETDKEHCARNMVKQMLYQGYTLPDEAELRELENEISGMFPNAHTKARAIIDRMVR